MVGQKIVNTLNTTDILFESLTIYVYKIKERNVTFLFIIAF